MKKILLLLFFVIFASAACGGSATEVGNPTGGIPTTYQTFTGTVATATIEQSVSKASILMAIDPTTLSVYATDEDNKSISDALDSAGVFILMLPVGHVYAFSIYNNNNVKIGDFDFEIDDSGSRGDEVDVETEIEDEINMGEISFVDGKFKPEFEPRQQFRAGSDQGN